MKKVLCFAFVVLILLSGCSQDKQSYQPGTCTFTESDNGNIVSDSGLEYALLANEGDLYYLSELEFLGSVQGEEKMSQHEDFPYQTGMYRIKGAANDNILVRRTPNSEWFSIYRKTSLPPFDFSVDNCIRLEFVFPMDSFDGNGMDDASEIAEFLSVIRSQKDPHEAGLYDLIKKPDGMLENCYVYGEVYGFFKEEPQLAVRMDIWSYNDLAYSISLDGLDYVLPTEWLEKIVKN